MNYSYLHLLYLFSSFHGLFLISLLLLNKKMTKAGVFLVLILAFFTFYLFENTIYLSGHLKRWPHFLYTSLPLTFLIGPLFYHYIRSNVFPNRPLRWVHLFHLSPFLFEFFILIPFYRLSAQMKVKLYEYSLQITESPGWNIYWVGFLIYILSTFGFCYAGLRLLKNTNNKGTKAAKKRLWLKRAARVFLIYLILNMFFSILGNIYFEYQLAALHFGLIGMVIIVHSLGYIAFLFPKLLHSNGEKYQSSALKSAAILDLQERLLKLMNEKKPYLDAELTPESLAEQLDISKNHLSQILSEGLNTNYYALINQYRVEEAKKLLLTPQYQDAKILHVAFDSGFSNKSSFLRNFKKITGLTPSAYKKRFHSIQ